MNKKTKQTIALALGAAFIGSATSVANADAAELFAAKDVSAYEVVGSLGKKGEGDCGEGNCGGHEGKDKSGAEGSCGEGRCGG